MSKQKQQVQAFELKFKYENIKTATVHVTHHGDYPQYRVSVPEGTSEDVYILYLVKKEQVMFAWYPLPAHKDEVAKAIAKALERRN